MTKHKCPENTSEYHIEKGWNYDPNPWYIFADYNVNIKVNYCPFCGEKLEVTNGSPKR